MTSQGCSKNVFGRLGFNHFHAGLDSDASQRNLDDNISNETAINFACEESDSTHRCYPFIPNFRPVKISDSSQDCIPLYRSSRPDLMTASQVQHFLSLDIKCILDFRSKSEYKKAHGNKLLDAMYPIYSVEIPKSLSLQCGESVNVVGVSKSLNDKFPSVGKKHVLIDFFKTNYISAIFWRAPWYIRLYSLFIFLFDIVLNNGFKNFVGLFARSVLNPAGLGGQYVDMVNYSQASICSALKLLTQPDNLPAMLNCAHGKDRTGVVSALVMSCLGCEEKVIVQEYSRSEVELAPIKSRIYSEIVERYSMSPKFIGSDPGAIQTMIKYINNRWGSIPNYLEYIGFSRREQISLRDNLLCH